MFLNMNTSGSGAITHEELKIGFARLGSKLSEEEIAQLFAAVRNLEGTIKSFLFGILELFTYFHRLFLLR